MLYDGTISGEYVNLEKDSKIEMKWKMKDWDAYSDVVITFEQGDDVSLTQEEIKDINT